MGEGNRITLLGFAGHRAVHDPDGLKDAIYDEITELKRARGDRITAISSAASGADLIFLRSCAELEIPAIVILPFPKSRFAEDFDDGEEWKLAEHLTGVAIASYVAPGCHRAPEAYHQVSRHLLDWADTFLFVWDGEEPRGAGGTGETVREARRLEIPSRVINAASLEARWEVAPQNEREPRHSFNSRAELLERLDARFAGS